MTKSIASLERLVRIFRRMTYLGIAVIALGIGVSFALTGDAQYFVFAGSVGSGGMMVFVGIREARRGNVLLEPLRAKTPKSRNRQ